MPVTRPSIFSKLFGRKLATFQNVKPSSTPTRLGVTVLEDREMPSVSVTNGSLYVNGTSGPDTLTVVNMAVPTVSGGSNLILRVNENGVVTDVPRSQVTGKIYVYGLASADTISVNSTIPAVIDGGAGNDTLFGGTGANTYPNAERQDRITDPVLTAGRAMGPAVMARYQALGGSAGYLGLPTENQQTSGRFDWCHFQGGAIVYTDTTGAHAVGKAVLAKYEALGGGGGALGAPVEDQKSGAGMEWCHFEGGVIVSSSLGAFTLNGVVLAEYEAAGGGGGYLGAPTEDQKSGSGFVWCHFQHGAVVGTASGAYAMGSEILAKYESLGGGGGWLGAPTSRQHIEPDGSLQVDFQKGSIVWRSDTGAHLAISRGQMIALIKATEADNVLDGNEFNFLHGCVADQNTWMLPAVRNLTKKVIDGDPANASFQGAAVGNLRAGSPGWAVDVLERKWFEGQDHPAAVFNRAVPVTTANPNGLISINGGAYQTAVGPLFRAGGPVYTDIFQGNVGDCTVLASLATVALKSSDALQRRFTDNGDGTYTIQMWQNGSPSYVTVDNQLPSGGATFDRINGGPIWVALIEKAYVQINEGRTIGSTTGSLYPRVNSYGAIDTGNSSTVVAALSTLYGGTAPTTDSTNIGTAWAGGQLIVLGTGNAPPVSGIEHNHAYAVVGYDAVNQMYTLFNPWGVNGGTDTVENTFKWGTFGANQAAITQNFGFGVHTYAALGAAEAANLALWLTPVTSIEARHSEEAPRPVSASTPKVEPVATKSAADQLVTTPAIQSTRIDQLSAAMDRWSVALEV